jgi:hypothetical protein
MLQASGRCDHSPAPRGRGAFGPVNHVKRIPILLQSRPKEGGLTRSPAVSLSPKVRTAGGVEFTRCCGLRFMASFTTAIGRTLWRVLVQETATAEHASHGHGAPVATVLRHRRPLAAVKTIKRDTACSGRSSRTGRERLSEVHRAGENYRGKHGKFGQLRGRSRSSDSRTPMRAQIQLTDATVAECSP